MVTAFDIGLEEGFPAPLFSVAISNGQVRHKPVNRWGDGFLPTAPRYVYVNALA
jgi:hypothetical protein